MTEFYKEVSILKKPSANRGINTFSIHKTPCPTINMKTLIDSNQEPATLLSNRNTDDKKMTLQRSALYVEGDRYTDKDCRQSTKTQQSVTEIHRLNDQLRSNRKTKETTNDMTWLTSVLKSDKVTELDTGKLLRRKTIHSTESVSRSRNKTPVLRCKNIWMTSGRTQMHDKTSVKDEAYQNNSIETVQHTQFDRNTFRSHTSVNREESEILPELGESQTNNQIRPMETYTVQIPMRNKRNSNNRKQTLNPAKAGGVIFNKGIVIQQKDNESRTRHSMSNINRKPINSLVESKRKQSKHCTTKSSPSEDVQRNDFNTASEKTKFSSKQHYKSLEPDDNRKLNTKIKDKEGKFEFEDNSLLNNTVVAAIDFGTTYSGYAFLSTEEYIKNSLSVTTKIWTSPHYKTSKTSTSILFDENRNFHSFGFEAEAKYLRLLEDKNENVDDWYYFTRFKMILYQNMNIGINTKLRDHMGKQMSALKVFSSVIAYMKADLLAMCQECHSGVDQEEVQWVLTVPALWNDKAKTFMREAARKAGIPNDKLIMALEPEAASLYCLEWMKRSDVSEFHRGEKFLVLDAGGGTVDIAVHQIQENGKIQELHRANGGDWGGIKVDREFRKLLEDIISKEVLSELEIESRHDYFDIFHSFEKTKRRDFSIVGHGKVQLKFPSIVNRLCMNIKQKDVNAMISENERLKNSVRLIRDKIEIDLEFFKSLFSGVIQDVLNHLTTLLQKTQVKDVSTILMVGGFSECYLLQESIQELFPILKVIVPQDSALAILKGAVLYGHSPRTFQSRISTFTYGIETTEPFSKSHPEDKKIDISGSFHCDKIFCIHVKDGETVTIGKSVSKTYKTIDPDQTHMEFIIFASTKKHPKYTDDDSCFRVGTLTVNVSNIACNKYGEKRIKLELIYGGTELEAVATDIKTGKSSREHFKLGYTKPVRNNHQ